MSFLEVSLLPVVVEGIDHLMLRIVRDLQTINLRLAGLTYVVVLVVVPNGESLSFLPKSTETVYHRVSSFCSSA